MKKIKQNLGRTRNPLVSIVMPVYNSEQYLRTSITSILNQSYKNFEFIIIDDGSTDRSHKLLKLFKKKDKRIKLYVNRKNIGVAKSLNKALLYSKGKYIARMDSDDWSYPSRLETQVQIMENNPNIVLCGAYIEVCDGALKIRQVRKYNTSDLKIRSRMFRYSPFAHPVTMWKANLLKKEKYNETVKVGEDYELYFRMGMHGEFMNIPKILLKLRMHRNSVSSSMNDLQSKETIQIRIDAVKMLGYRMTIFDRLYNLLQTFLIQLIPVRLRFSIFNFLRKFEFF